MAFNFEPFDVDSLPYYQSHKRELMELFDSLADDTSKRALYHYVEAFIKNCVYKGEHLPTRWKYFFGGKYERLYKHLNGECWINCGASVGDTIFSYFSWDFKPKKIYAFEGDEPTFKTLLKNLSLLPPDKRELVEPINEIISETTDFEKFLAGNKCTFLNADIEGAELFLLHEKSYSSRPPRYGDLRLSFQRRPAIDSAIHSIDLLRLRLLYPKVFFRLRALKTRRRNGFVCRAD